MTLVKSAISAKDQYTIEKKMNFRESDLEFDLKRAQKYHDW